MNSSPSDSTDDEMANNQETLEVLRREKEEQSKLPYQWKQTLDDVDLTIVVPSGTRGKDINIKITTDHLIVGIKGQEPIIDGRLANPIKTEDSTWTIGDQKVLEVHLEKNKKQEWWSHVVEGHPKIDTTKIMPEDSKLDDLDGETRAMVEKMMFDQRQKAMGKPSSDELRKKEMFAKFQAQHPELNFSQAKMM